MGVDPAGNFAETLPREPARNDNIAGVGGFSNTEGAMAATLVRGKYIITRVTGPASAETLTESAVLVEDGAYCQDRLHSRN